MGSFTVTAVGEPRPWTGKFGEMLAYDLELDGPGGKTMPGTTAELSQKPSTPAPSVGQVLDGELVEQAGRWKFKKAPKQFSPGAGVPSQTVEVPFRTPEQIMAGEAWQVTGRIMAAKIQQGQNPSRKEVEETAAGIFERIKDAA